MAMKKFILPFRNLVVSPGTAVPVLVDNPLSVNCVKTAAQSGQQQLILVPQHTWGYPTNLEDIYSVGTIGDIIHIFTMDMLKPIEEKALAITDDMRILATAIDFLNNVNNELIFITNDLALKHIAKSFFNTLKLDSVKEDYDDDYQGYKEINAKNSPRPEG